MQTAGLTQSNSNEAKAALFLQTIKKETEQQHLNLESKPLLSAITSVGVTVQQYYYYLVLMQQVESVYEQQVLPQLHLVLPGMQFKKASQLIAEDLQHISLPVPEPIKTKCYDLHMKEMSVPFALGFMYVMEGSKLGGRVIFKHIKRMLGFSEQNGAKFIANYGNDTISHWKEFLFRFSNYAVLNSCEEEVISGASHAFLSIAHFFDENNIIS